MEAMGFLLTYETNAVPLMDDCQVLIYDRYIDNYVVNKYKSERAKELLDSMDRCNLRFYLVCDADIASERIAKRGRQMQSDLDVAQQKCIQYHNIIMESELDFYVVIDSSGSVEETFNRISECVEKYLPKCMG